MEEYVADILKQFGSIVVLVRGNDQEGMKGFVYPVESNSWQNLEKEVSPLGEASRRQYGYMLPLGTIIAEGDVLKGAGKYYRVRRAQVFVYRNEPIYQWGICVEKEANDVWGSQS